MHCHSPLSLTRPSTRRLVALLATLVLAAAMIAAGDLVGASWRL